MNYECHITTSVQFSEVATKIAKAEKWKTSEIARDPVLGDAVYFYLTKHSTSYIEIYKDMMYVKALLEANEAPVIRMKIELIMYDTKTGVGV